jgi:hypothetical protein
VEEKTMRGFLSRAAATAVVGAGVLISTSAQAIGPTRLQSAIEQVAPIERVSRVCREVCNGDVCRRRCFNRADYNEGYVERRVYRERSRDSDDRWRPRDYERGPGVRLNLGFD